MLKLNPQIPQGHKQKVKNLSSNIFQNFPFELQACKRRA